MPFALVAGTGARGTVMSGMHKTDTYALVILLPQAAPDETVKAPMHDAFAHGVEVEFRTARKELGITQPASVAAAKAKAQLRGSPLCICPNVSSAPALFDRRRVTQRHPLLLTRRHPRVSQ